ncbi:MAG TPA: hypothetical protein VF384_10870 [Planctomycetota bacterium]
MNARDEAEAAFLAAALEERLGALPPPDLSRAILRASRRPGGLRSSGAGASAEAAAVPPRRSALLAAVVLLGGIAVVGGVAIAPRDGVGTAVAAPQEPKPEKAAGPMDAAAHFPLALGNRWEYQEVIGDATRSVEVTVTARVAVDGVVISQLTTIGDGDPTFAFWSADARGVRHHASDSWTIDPMFNACKVEGLVLPSPIGAEAEWTWQTLPPQHFPKGVGGGRRKTPDPIEGKATLLGVGEQVRVGEQTFSCVHVRTDTELPAGSCVEHLYFARGVGIVRRTSKTGEGPETCRELVKFTPAMPRPDRDHVLATALGDAGKTCTWIELPAADDTAWVLRSEFALEPRQDGVRFHRLFGDRIAAFDPASLADFQALAHDEDFGPRMEGLFPQRMTVGLARLCARLRAAQLGQRFDRDNGMSVEIGLGGTKTTLPVSFVAEDGSRTAHEIVVRTRNAVPVAVLFDGR